MSGHDPITRRDVTDQKALQTVIDQLRLHVNHLILQSAPASQAHLSRTNTQIVGPWSAANLTRTKDLDLELAAGTPTEYVAPRKGWLTSPQFHLNLPHTDGVLRFKVKVTSDGVERIVTDHEVVIGQTFYSPEDYTEVEFKRGDHIVLGFQTDGLFTPNGSLDITAWLEVRM